MTTNTSLTWLDSVLGKSKQGVFRDDFEGLNNTVVEVGDGGNAMLDCKVFLKLEKTVWLKNTNIFPNLPTQITWMRHTRADPGKPDLLTVGKTTYTGDNRFRASFRYPNNWRLEMHDLHITDSGDYFCQIASHPPTVLHYTLIIAGELCSYHSGCTSNQLKHTSMEQV